jgi:adenosyl cobinamide kinase/adenosyl cobinamide phosphate guanylyltransferase
MMAILAIKTGRAREGKSEYAELHILILWDAVAHWNKA